jgi:branched-chain amino acid aminotransferase
LNREFADSGSTTTIRLRDSAARRRAGTPCALRDALRWWRAVTAAPYSAVFFQGRFVAPEDACVRVTDPGYLLGEGVFATLRAYDGVCFRAERHLTILARGAAMFGLELPCETEHLASIADEAASRVPARDAYVRVTVTRGGEGAVLSVLSRPLVVPSDADYARGVSATVVTARRIPPACIDGTVKTTSYAPQVLARREAMSRGIGEGEGIMLSAGGSLACGTMANLFLVMGDTLVTPSLASGCRAGVTRETVLEIAESVGLTKREASLDLAELFDAEEAFFTSTRVECLPIAAVDGRAVGSARRGLAIHPRTTALRARLRALVAEEAPHATTARRRQNR